MIHGTGLTFLNIDRLSLTTSRVDGRCGVVFEPHDRLRNGKVLREMGSSLSCKFSVRTIVSVLCVSTTLAVLAVGISIFLERDNCAQLTGQERTALIRDLSSIHPETLVKFAIPYRGGKNLIKQESVQDILLFQVLGEAGWEVDWFQTYMVLPVHGLCIVVNSFSVGPPDVAVELARVLARHSIKVEWREDPSVVPLTNEWCIYVGC